MSWETVTLGDICIVDWGNTSLTKKSYIKDGKFLAVSAAGCDGRIGHKEHKKFTPVLSAIGAKCGRMFFPDEDFTAIKNTITLTPNEDIADNKFLYFLLTFVDLPRRGAGQPFISKGDIQKFWVSIPSISEQKRIVAILDEAFAGISQAVHNAEKNLASARELFESYLNNVFTQKGEGWVEKLLGDVIKITHGFAFKGMDFKVSSNKDFPIVLTPGNYTEDATLNFDMKNTKRLMIDPPDGYEFDEGDLTIVMTDLSSKMKILGKPALIERKGILHNQRIGRILFSDATVSKRYLYYYLQSDKVSDTIKMTSTGTMVRHTAPKRILSINISFPVKGELQDEIVEQLDVLKAKTQHLEIIYQNKLTALTELKQSILQKAFAGELTTEPANLKAMA